MMAEERESSVSRSFHWYPISRYASPSSHGQPEDGYILGSIADPFVLPLGTRLFLGRARTTGLTENLKHV